MSIPRLLFIIMLTVLLLVFATNYNKVTLSHNSRKEQSVESQTNIKNEKGPNLEAKVYSPIPSEPFTIYPKLVGPGDDVEIHGGWPTETSYSIYVTDGSTKYLIGKAGFGYGMNWEGTIDKTLRTLDGKEIKLPKDKYHFLIEGSSNKWEGGLIDLTPMTVPIPPGSEIRMTAAAEVQVALDLFTQHLNRYKETTLPDYLQLKDFKIDPNQINLIEGTYSPLIYEIKYSVLPVRPDSDWVSGVRAGQGDWYDDKVIYMKVVAKNGQFELMGLSPRPPEKESSGMFEPSIIIKDAEPALRSIGQKLMNAYLEHFKAASIPERSRLQSYQVNKLEITSESVNVFNFFVDYTVQGVSKETDWVAGNGKIMDNGLVEHKVWFVRVSKDGNTYSMTGAGTSP